MHYLQQVIKKVDHTHPGLGKPVAVAMLSAKAHKLLLLISPRGCGKSCVGSLIANSYPDALMKDRISIPGLASLAGTFSNYDGVVVVDDIAKAQTPYARIATLTSMAELVYGHRVSSNLYGGEWEINDFRGGALVNIQPVLLAHLETSDEWEASLVDKSIRYYHFFRPLKPNPKPISLELDWGTPFEEVGEPRMSGKLWRKLSALGEVHWGVTRQVEHTRDLLRATAALDKRRHIKAADYSLLTRLLQPLKYELLVTGKVGFESGRWFNSNLCAILTEYFTYGEFTLKQLARDYMLSQPQCYRIMQKEQKLWKVVSKSPTMYAPSDELMDSIESL